MKVGDIVKVKDEWKEYCSKLMHLPIPPDTGTTIIDIREENSWCQLGSCPSRFWMPEWLEHISSIEDSSKDEPICQCDIKALFDHGCQCNKR